MPANFNMVSEEHYKKKLFVGTQFFQGNPNPSIDPSLEMHF